jgi:competence ComEA-like helix-hairpin-helix protein
MKAASLSAALIVLLAICFAACSKKQVFESRDDNVVSSPNAININAATVSELAKLPNIGPRTAEAIVQFRTVHGPFRRPEQLLQIRGVSEERFAELRPLIKTE